MSSGGMFVRRLALLAGLALGACATANPGTTGSADAGGSGGADAGPDVDVDASLPGGPDAGPVGAAGHTGSGNVAGAVRASSPSYKLTGTVKSGDGQSASPSYQRKGGVVGGTQAP